MNAPDEKSREALRRIVEDANSRERPALDWITPLQDVINNGSLFSSVAKNMPFPMAIYGINGNLEAVNDFFLKETGLTCDDIKAGHVNIFHIESPEFTTAARLSLRYETSLVNGLHNPLQSFLADNAAPEGDYKSAILFPFLEDGPVIRAVTLFLPCEFE